MKTERFQLLDGWNKRGFSHPPWQAGDISHIFINNLNFRKSLLSASWLEIDTVTFPELSPCFPSSLSGLFTVLSPLLIPLTCRSLSETQPRSPTIHSCYLFSPNKLPLVQQNPSPKSLPFGKPPGFPLLRCSASNSSLLGRVGCTAREFCITARRQPLFFSMPCSL